MLAFFSFDIFCLLFVCVCYRSSKREYNSAAYFQFVRRVCLWASRAQTVVCFKWQNFFFRQVFVYIASSLSERPLIMYLWKTANYFYVHNHRRYFGLWTSQPESKPVDRHWLARIISLRIVVIFIAASFTGISRWPVLSSQFRMQRRMLQLEAHSLRRPFFFFFTAVT